MDPIRVGRSRFLTGVVRNSPATRRSFQPSKSVFNLSVALGKMGQRDQALEIAQIALALAEAQAYSQLTIQIRDHQTNLEKGR